MKKNWNKILLSALTLVFLGSTVFSYSATPEEQFLGENIGTLIVRSESSRGTKFVDDLYKMLKTIQQGFVNQYGYGYERKEVLATIIIAKMQEKLPRLLDLEQ